MKTLSAVIIGASGYTGAELTRLLTMHPHVRISALVADSNAGKEMASVYPHFSSFALPALVTLEEVSWDGVDVVFCCLPHSMSHRVIDQLPEGIKVIDLSADFRLNDVALYEEWYGPHAAPALQEKAVYGLTEWYRDSLKNAEIVACPGCYPTCALLPLLPLIKGNVIDPSQIIVDAKSGMSGAGRSSKQPNLFAEMAQNMRPYAIGEHRHIPEMEHILKSVTGTSCAVHFTPQVVPTTRGMLATIYVQLEQGQTTESIQKAWQASYENEPFIHVVDAIPAMADVAGSNLNVLYVTEGRLPNQAVIVSVIDNLVKGASGQAVQNMNLLFGFDETAGLSIVPLFP